MKVIVSADDFANSPNISKEICECFDEGVLTSTSVMINSDRLEDSLDMLKERSDLRVSLHLNIAEGYALSSREEIFDLVDSEGRFDRSFEALLFSYYLGSRERKDKLKKQIKCEFKAQIELFAKKLDTTTVALDSHQHYHALPFVTDAVVELATELENIEVTYIRVPDEPFFLQIVSLDDLKNYIGLNIVKHLLLKLLSRYLKKQLTKSKIEHNDSFIGVLFTGNVTLESIKSALNSSNAKSVEILLHPGSISPSEAEKRAHDRFRDFYMSQSRKKEAELLKSESLREYLMSKC